MKKFAELQDQLIQIEPNHLHNLIGYPVLEVVRKYSYACNKHGVKLMRCWTGTEETWRIFDGTISMCADDITFWIFKSLID